MTRQAWLGIAALGLIVLAVLGGAVMHERDRRVEFVSLAKGESDIHPGRTFEAAFLRPAPSNATAVLTGGGVTLATTVRRVEGAPSRLSIRPDAPLQWASSYRLCILQQHQRYVQLLIGPRTNCISFRTRKKPPPSGPADAPILVVTGRDALYGAFYGEILKAEGLNSYATRSSGDFGAKALDDRKVVVLATSMLGEPAIGALSSWVRRGGLLIAMRPQPELYPLLGLKRFSAGSLNAASLLADRTLSASRGISGRPLRLHGQIGLLTPSRDDRTSAAGGRDAGDGTAGEDVRTLAQLADVHDKPLPYAAATIVKRGRGHAVAFAFDLATSIVLSRQGNPLWAGNERDHSVNRRPDDLFYPDFVDLDNVEVPQADELQRLFANTIVSDAPQPVPRFWYLPGNRRAAIIMAGDDHATRNGTRSLFDRLEAESPPGCRRDAWNCLRATSYLTPPTKLARPLAEHYSRLGFELGVHVDSGCRNRPTKAVANAVRKQMVAFHDRYPLLPPQTTHRIHCIVWNGWVDLPRIERQNGIRLDMNYYYWPPWWIKQRPGFMTGSGFPMPYVDENGKVLDIYQAASHLVNQDGVPQEYGISVMLDRALGNDQFFAALGTHYDYTDRFADRLVNAARERGVALITARQMLAWLDGRNGSRFSRMQWNGTSLTFATDVHPGAEHASVMLPASFAHSRLAALTCGDRAMPVTRQTIKGIEYGFAPAFSGECEARYVAEGGTGAPAAKGEEDRPTGSIPNSGDAGSRH